MSKPPLRISVHHHVDPRPSERLWRCEKCLRCTRCTINPVECLACDGEMVRAPQGSREKRGP